MKIELIGHGIQVTAALKTFTEEKFSKLFNHYADIQSCHVSFKVEKLQQMAQATLLYQKNEIYAKAEAVDLYMAIDLLVKKLEPQLERSKELHLGHQE